jgi:hypothetical protein
MPAITENFGDLIEPGLRKIFTDQYNRMSEMSPTIFNVNTTDKPYEKDSSVGAFGDMPPFTGTVQYDEVYQGYDVKYEFAEFVLGFKVERKLFDDDMYNIINRKPSGLSISAKRTKEKYGASVFNNAFTGTGTITVNGLSILTNSETLSLCNTAHTSSASSTTQGNYGTSALSPSAVEATRILGHGIKDDRDNIISVNYDTIMVPRNLEETAWVIINTTGKVDSAENNKNFHYGKYKLAVWDDLSDSNNWFMLDQAMSKMFLSWYTRIALEFNQDKSFDTYISKFSAYERYGWGWSDWRWLYGHKVS